MRPSGVYNGESEDPGGSQSRVAKRVELLSSSEKMTHALGVGLGQVLHEGDLVCLQGELGSGKTHLTKGIAAGLGVTERVTSPTFIIVNEYSLAERRFKLYHIDLYRVESLAEARATGLDEYWSGSDICVIEWAERVRALLPADRLWVHLEHCSPSSRRMAFEACGPRSIELLERFQPVMARMLATRGVGSVASRCS